MEFPLIWIDISKNNLLGYHATKTLFDILQSCPTSGSTAEIGVYLGKTSRMIAMATNEIRLHYAYYTFLGITDAREGLDGPTNGEYQSSVEVVRSTLGPFFSRKVVLKKGDWRERIHDPHPAFSFVYMDTGTYKGSRHTLSILRTKMETGGKIVFYVGGNCYGVKKGLEEVGQPAGFHREYISPFVIFTWTG